MIATPALNQSQKIWLAMILGLVLALVLTAWSDWVFTGLAPNPLFYFVAIASSILGSVLAMWAWAAMLRPRVPWLELVRVVVGATVVMQLLEVVEKAIYYYVWGYPSFLYLLFNIAVNLVLTSALLVRFSGIRRVYAAILAIIGFVGGLLLGGIVTFATGLTTPGS